MSVDPGPLSQPCACLKWLWEAHWEASRTILQMRTLGSLHREPGKADLASVRWWTGGLLADMLASEGQEPAQVPVVSVESRPQQEGRLAVDLQAAMVDSLPCFLWVPSPYGLYDQLQTTLFPKNKHAYRIGGSFVAIKGNNRVFKKITLRFK